jgi:hypothetical protein
MKRINFEVWSHIRDIYVYTYKSLVGKGTRYEYHIPIYEERLVGMKPIVQIKEDKVVIIFSPKS